MKGRAQGAGGGGDGEDGGAVHDNGQHDLLLRPEWRAGRLGYQNRLVMRN